MHGDVVGDLNFLQSEQHRLLLEDDHQDYAVKLLFSILAINLIYLVILRWVRLAIVGLSGMAQSEPWTVPLWPHQGKKQPQ